MFTPHKFLPADDKLVRDFIRENGFGILVSQADGQLWATHTPMMLSKDEKKLSGHIARANQSWKSFEQANNVMAIFHGPHAYISSSWYDHENVPTWNYIAAHVYGSIRIIEGQELYGALKELVDHYEKHLERPLSLEKMTPGYVEKNMRGIVGFEINIERIEATQKLSQNRDAKNYQTVINELEKRVDQGSHDIANEMKKNKSRLFE